MVSIVNVFTLNAEFEAEGLYGIIVYLPHFMDGEIQTQSKHISKFTQEL